MKLLFGNAISPLEVTGALLVLGCVVFALMARRESLRTSRRIEQALRKVSRRRLLAIVVTGVLPVLLRLALLPIYSPPEPWTHDEFCFLLHADTFASGRITNPPHPHWVHFESIYVLSQPTYTAKYQPGQGLVLAAGELIGSPWTAVVVSMGVLCALLCWMLQGWLPPGWAFLGGVIAAIEVGVLSYWMNSYWGGTVAAIGGTLVLGALPRLRRGGGVGHALLLGFGLVIVMHTRPLEALLLALSVAGAMLWFVFRTRELLILPTVWRVMLPASVVVLAGVAAMGYYNWRVTGSPLQMPYMLHIKTYGTPQGFFWQAPYHIDAFRHPEIKDEYLRQRALHVRRSSPKALALSTLAKLRTWWSFYVGPVLTLPLLFLPWPVRNKRVILALVLISPFALFHFTYHAYFPHYAAPIMGLFLFVSLQGWRRLRVWRWRGRRAGLFLARALPVISCATVLIAVTAKVVGPALPTSLAFLNRVWRDEFSEETTRSAIRKKLREHGGRHLVFVRYRHPGHNPDEEWVYNSADIDNSEVVWAREWTEESNRELMKYFRDREVWIAEPDTRPVRLSKLKSSLKQVRTREPDH